MRASAVYLRVFLVQMLAVACAVSFCKWWLLGAVDRASGFWRAGERHDDFLPGEGPFLLAFYCGSVALAVVLALLIYRRSADPGFDRKVALRLAVPAGVAGVALFDFVLSRLWAPEIGFPFGTLPLFGIGGAILGTALCGDRK